MKNLIKKILRENLDNEWGWVYDVEPWSTHVTKNLKNLKPHDEVVVIDESSSYFGNHLTVERLVSDEESGYGPDCHGVFTTYEHDELYFCGTEVVHL